MAIDLTIELDNTAGELARLGEAFGARGVNIDGLCAITSGGPIAEVHILVDDAEGAFTALGEAGIPIGAEQEVLVLEVEDRPGVIGDISRRLGDADVNITLVYLATATRLVVGADDLATARSVIEER